MEPSATYVTLTEAIVSALGGSHALVHVQAGLAIYVVVQLLTRDRRASLHGLITVVGLELANELMEAIHYGALRPGDTLGDIAATLGWPAILFGVGRYRRRRYRLALSRSAFRPASSWASAPSFPSGVHPWPAGARDASARA
jgi:hypothetical protein